MFIQLFRFNLWLGQAWHFAFADIFTSLKNSRQGLEINLKNAQTGTLICNALSVVCDSCPIENCASRMDGRAQEHKILDPLGQGWGLLVVLWGVSAIFLQLGVKSEHQSQRTLKIVISGFKQLTNRAIAAFNRAIPATMMQGACSWVHTRICQPQFLNYSEVMMM